jgi:hypothetical protein
MWEVGFWDICTSVMNRVVRRLIPKPRRVTWVLCGLEKAKFHTRRMIKGNKPA